MFSRGEHQNDVLSLKVICIANKISDRRYIQAGQRSLKPRQGLFGCASGLRRELVSITKC